MANIKISQLPSLATLADTTVFSTVDSGVNYKSSALSIKNYITWPVTNTTGSNGPTNIAIGKNAGATGNSNVAIGIGAAGTGNNIITIGTNAGQGYIGNGSILIGPTGSVSANSLIVFNATGATLTPVSAQNDSFYVAPIRNNAGTSGVLQYNSTTKEVTYGNAITIGSKTWTFGTDGTLSSAMFLASAGSYGTNGYSFTGDGGLDTGMFSSGDGNIQFYSNTTKVVEIASGNIAIFGTTTLATSLSGVLKATAGVVSTATAGTDYIAPYTSQTQNYVLAAPSSTNGTPTFRALAATDLPIATTSAVGGVKVDGTTISINNGVITASNTSGLLTVATSGGTTTLTSSSVTNILLTGTNTHTIQLPDATTIPAGQMYRINNNSSSASNITINNAGGSQAGVIPTGGFVQVISNSNATANGSWDVHYFIPTNLPMGASIWQLGSSSYTIAPYNSSLTIGSASSVSTTYNFGTGATTSGNTKTVNIGTAGVSGSTTNITLGSSVSGATSLTTVNGALKIVDVRDTVYAATFASTFTPDGANGAIQNVTLTGSITINAFANPQAGQTITLILTQGGSGSYTLTSSMKFAGGLKTLSTAVGSVDLLTITYTGSVYYASLVVGFV